MNPTPVINFTPRGAALAAVAVLPFLLASGPLAAAPSYDTFSTDPNISTEWTSYGYYNSPPGGVATWNSTNQITFGGYFAATATIDNFEVIPEPRAALLGGLGLLALLRRRR